MLTQGTLQSFKKWLDAKDIPNRPGKGDYQVLQVYTGRQWSVLHRANNTKTLTVGEGLQDLVREFMAERLQDVGPWKSVHLNPPPPDELVLTKGSSGYATHETFYISAYWDKEYEAWYDPTRTRLSDSGWEPTHWRSLKEIA